jgi:hypothetical protein
MKSNPFRISMIKQPTSSPILQRTYMHMNRPEKHSDYSDQQLLENYYRDGNKNGWAFYCRDIHYCCWAFA